jgi:hypothetical protein
MHYFHICGLAARAFVFIGTPLRPRNDGIRVGVIVAVDSDTSDARLDGRELLVLLFVLLLLVSDVCNRSPREPVREVGRDDPNLPVVTRPRSGTIMIKLSYVHLPCIEMSLDRRDAGLLDASLSTGLMCDDDVVMLPLRDDVFF